METMEDVGDGYVGCFDNTNYHTIPNQHDELWLLLTFYFYKMIQKVGLSLKDSF